MHMRHGLWRLFLWREFGGRKMSCANRSTKFIGVAKYADSNHNNKKEKS